jgi:glycosyltransferase involved in cell wall biosynthesis
MAAGLPVIASRLPGLTEIIPGGDVAWFFPPGSHQDLARLMLEVPRQHDLAAAGQRARRLSVEFGIEATCQQYRKVYEELLAKGRRRAARPRQLDLEV